MCVLMLAFIFLRRIRDIDCEWKRMRNVLWKRMFSYWWWWWRSILNYKGGILEEFFLVLTATHNFLIYLKKKFFYSFYCRLKREDGQITIIQAMAQPQQNSLQQQNIQQPVLDHDEKKMRRQIANSNERRRMQSINAGFQSLRQLLPHHEGEKLSKVSHSFLFTSTCA